MTIEKKKILFLNRKLGEKIKLTIGDEVIEVILKETTRTTARIGIRANEIVDIARLDAEPETLEAIELKKLDRAAKRKLKRLEPDRMSDDDVKRIDKMPKHRLNKLVKAFDD